MLCGGGAEDVRTRQNLLLACWACIVQILVPADAIGVVSEDARHTATCQAQILRQCGGEKGPHFIPKCGFRFSQDHVCPRQYGVGSFAVCGCQLNRRNRRTQTPVDS